MNFKKKIVKAINSWYNIVDTKIGKDQIMNHNFSYQPPQVPDYAGYQVGQPDGPKNKGKAFAITSLILGILSMLSCCCCCDSIFALAFMGILGAGAVVFAIVSRMQTGKLEPMAIAGLILGIIALIALLFMLAMILFFSTVPVEELEKILIEAFGEDFAEEFFASLETTVAE